MRRIVIIALGCLVALASCKNNKEFVLNGKVENAGSIKKVQLFEMDQLVDSAFLNEDNEFKFKKISADPNF